MRLLLPILLVTTHGPASDRALNDRVCLTAAAASSALEQNGSWGYPPEILVCATGPVTMDRVEKAIKYWTKLGYTFGIVEEAPRDHYGCATGKVPYNTIMIDIPSQSFKMGVHLGSTKTWRNNDNEQHPRAAEIFKAKIEIIPAWGATERILEHEIGHALGWNDVTHTGHMMNGVWSLGGYNSRGLKQ